MTPADIDQFLTLFHLATGVPLQPPPETRRDHAAWLCEVHTAVAGHVARMERLAREHRGPGPFTYDPARPT